MDILGLIRTKYIYQGIVHIIQLKTYLTNGLRFSKLRWKPELSKFDLHLQFNCTKGSKYLGPLRGDPKM